MILKYKDKNDNWHYEEGFIVWKADNWDYIKSVAGSGIAEKSFDSEEYQHQVIKQYLKEKMRYNDGDTINTEYIRREI